MQYNRQIKQASLVGVSSILKDTNGNILENAHVYPLGDSSKGVITNKHGEFTLYKLDPNGYIVISYQGVTSSIQVSAVKKITVIDTTNSLPEVVINSNTKPKVSNNKNKWILGGVLATIFITRAVLKSEKKKLTPTPIPKKVIL